MREREEGMREREGGERGNRERRGSMEKDKEGENGKDLITINGCYHVYTLTILARCFSSFGWKLCIDSLVPCRTKSGRYVDE